jgi:TP901 family phage tail tape measure protein
VAADTAKLVAQLLLDDKDFQRGIKSAIRGVDQAESRMEKIGAHAQRGMGKAVQNIERGVALGAGAALVGLAGSVKLAADFEAQLNTINTVAQQTPVALEGIGAGIRQLSRDTGVATEDLTTAYYDLVSAGVKTADAQGVLNSAVTLGIGGLASTAETIDLLTTALNIYGGGAQEAATYSDYFAQAVAAGKVTAADIAATFASVGPLAKAQGIEITELAAGYAQLTAKGIPAAEAATAMEAAMIALVRTTGPLEKLQKKLNVNFADIAAEQGLQVAYEQLTQAAEKYNIPLIELVGRKEALAFAFNTTGDAAAGYNANLDAVVKSSDGVGVAADQAAKRQQGLTHQLNLLKANVKDAGVTIGTALLPELVSLGKEFTGFIQTNQPAIQGFAKDLAAGLRDAAKWARSLDWDAIGKALNAAGTGARAVASAFLSLPPWVQTAVITGWGLNKLTGGALTGIIGELGKGLVKGVLSMNAGVVNVNAAKVLPGMPGTGGGPGKGAGALGAVGKMFLVGEAIGLALLVNEVRNGIAEGNTETARANTETARAFVTENTLTRQQLTDAIAAVDKGIADLQSNPLNVLVQGDALTELQKQRAILAEQLARANSTPSTPTQRESGMERTGGNAGARVVDQASQLLGGMIDKAELQRIFEYGVQQGFKPSALSIISTFERNQDRTPPWVSTMEAANDRRAASAGAKMSDITRAVNAQTTTQALARADAATFYMSQATGLANTAAAAQRSATETAIMRATLDRKDFSVNVPVTVNPRVYINSRQVSSTTTRTRIVARAGQAAIPS